ncbi:hypothetical protein Glove_117g276 [Diversispora epigaea]|uniref:Uncharacterized protein n=1 Tax=Diversispora epigaea TaxID=1348612 RepID=A0A397J2N7_9GLOM|nr:hypothetical protein Glove_117g276 [Diversispora epigaea]
MITLSCKISKVPVTAILDSGANCNIIGKEVVNRLGLKIDDSSDIEVYNPISKLDVIGVIRIVGVIHEIEISIPSQDSKWKQVKVTDIFVVNSPEHALVLVIGSGIPLPIQYNQSVDEYVKTIKLYAASLSINLNNQDLKKTFFNGLSRENKKKVIRFGFKNSLNEIIEHLKFISTGPTNIQKF